MLTSGDVVVLDIGLPEAREAGLGRPAVVVTAQRILDADPSVLQIVPLTTTIRPFRSEVPVEPDAGNGLTSPSAAQCQHVRAVASGRVRAVVGNVGGTALGQVRETLALIFDLPG